MALLLTPYLWSYLGVMALHTAGFSVLIQLKRSILGVMFHLPIAFDVSNRVVYRLLYGV